MILSLILEYDESGNSLKGAKDGNKKSEKNKKQFVSG